MRIAGYIKEIGRGRDGARSLDSVEAHDLMSQVLDRRVTDREVGAFAIAMRIEGESVAEWKKRLTAEQRAELLEWNTAHRWCPNQIRHAFGTRVRKVAGLEAAQVTLGHSKADTTQIYAERNEALAAEIAAKIG